ncbi:hypothetical protein PFMALIP_04855 [Plasmodium falciparum MaliPS096_E11]|uniref:Surface antigen n=1 Tax=Plasmodium falciparum MaliPS096_E11 TaxID=1036727 RepID=A0A024WJC8_PLAFA|nr:hypothetical protein PFMALIP_04855 [Plasmodium falciparum MaliPS096_E11]
MKLHCSKILLFFFPLNILVTSYHVYSKNKPSITQHTPTTTLRVLSECDLYMPKYDNDADMKSVKENFDRQTSQRFEEFDERMKDKRRKCKEQCEKDIQKIILKDKIEKSLEEKVEKYCLICGCGLGGVAASLGIFGTIAVNEWTKAATAAATQKGIEAGIAKAIDDLGNIVGLIQFDLIDWAAKIDGINFLKQNSLVSIVNEVYYKCIDIENSSDFLFCSGTEAMGNVPKVNPVQVISTQAAEAAVAAGKAAETAEKAEIVLVNAKSSLLYSAIGYSVTVILIIVLVMVIIYLILRYRRKKKMNKKSQYTKLLNQ